ncbi:MAG: HAD family hydrolase [Desulfocapsaceae bacterium]|nr:HAD family hydrolase [Desulfocapsaceae bacterium]
MLYKAIIFDLDGTLLNSLNDLADSANAALKALSLSPHPRKSYQYFVGDGVRTLIERIMPQTSSEKQIRECEELYTSIYSAHWADQTCPYPGIATMLADLHAMGLGLAILSNKPDTFTRICADRFFQPGLYRCVRGQRVDTPRKPDPAGALIIAGELGINPKDILYVGDTATDMRTGRGAGMKTAGVLWGFRDQKELEASGADFIVRAPQEIVDLCQNP